jgi:hypothetical protein
MAAFDRTAVSDDWEEQIMGVRMRWLVLSGVLGLASVSVLSCKKDPPKEDSKADKDDDKDSKKKKKKSGDDDDGEAAVKYKNGDALKHVPGTCKAGYAYLNLGAFLKNEAIASNADSLQEKLGDAMKSGKDAKKASKALKALKKSGFDFTKDIKEFAMCAPSDWKDPVAIVGGNFSGKDILGALVKANDATGDGGDLEKKESDGISYLKMKKGVLALVGPNVIAVGDHKDDVFELKKKGSGADAWDVGKGRIFAMHVVDKKDMNVDGSITENGDNLDFKVAVEMNGSQGEQMKANPAQFKTEFKKMANQIADKLEKTPFKNLADDIRGAKIEIDGSKVTVTITSPASELALAIKTAAEASEDDLGKMFK